MLRSTLTQKLLQPCVFGTIGVLAIGLQPASAITLTGSGSGLVDTNFGCNNLTSNILDCYGFDNFTDSTKWLTAADGGKWAIKGTVIAANATLSNSTTGQGTAARVLTFTNATIEYKGGATTGTSSTFSGLSFSHNFDFTTTTTTRTGTVTTLFTNPIVSHRLSGQFAGSDGVAATNQVTSNVAFSGLGRIGTATVDSSIQYTNALGTNSLASGNPFGTSFSFYDAKDASMASLSNNGSSTLYLRNGTASATLQSIKLTQGDTLYLPASECTVIHDGGQNNGHGNGDQTAPGNSEDNNNAENSEHSGEGNSGEGGGGNPDGNSGYNKEKLDKHNKKIREIKTQDQFERLCNKVARSVYDPASVPESNSAVPVLGGLMLWGASQIIRRGKF